MPLGEALEDDDDYVASLLKTSAHKDHSRYLTNGLSALLSKKTRDGNAPKPNTRFLKHIIRETDSHNAALKAREEEDSRTRLRELGKKKEREGRWVNAFSGLGGDRHKRKRSREDDGAEAGDGKRSRYEEGQIRYRKHDERDDRSSSTHTSLRRSEHRQRDATDRRRDERDIEPEHRDSTSRHHRCTPTEKRGRERSRSPEHHKSRPQDHRVKHRRRSPEQNPRGLKHGAANDYLPSCRRDDKSNSSVSDSDLHASMIGPLPPSKPTRPRGRNAHRTTTSAMDARFEPTYNPKVDIDETALSDKDGDDWDMALEALRDRAKWQQAGADRLKAAGFTSEEVERWENGGEKGADDVRWSRKGEAREWDRGKTIDGEGGVVLKPEWARAQKGGG